MLLNQELQDQLESFDEAAMGHCASLEPSGPQWWHVAISCELLTRGCSYMLRAALELSEGLAQGFAGSCFDPSEFSA